MKKAITTSILLLTPFAWSAMATTQAPEIGNYYPLRVGDTWIYQVFDHKAKQGSSNRTVVVEVEREEIYVRPKMTKDGKEMPEKKFDGHILKSTSGGKTTRDHVVRMEDGIHRVHAADTQITPPLLFIKLPDAFVGKAWEANSTSGNTTIKGTFTPQLTDVKVGDRASKLLIISFRDNQQGEDRVEIDYWFLPGDGMAQQRIKTKGHEITLKLVKFTPAVKKG